LISSINSRVIAELPGGRALVEKEKDANDPNNPQQQQIQQLKQRDAEVRQHEAKHTSNPELIAVGAPKYTYVIGPDGKAYAVGGSVTVSTGKPRNAEDAMRKAMALKSSAMGVGEPSTQDMGAAISANTMIQQAITNSARQNPVLQNNDSSEKQNVENISGNIINPNVNIYENNGKLNPFTDEENNRVFNPQNQGFYQEKNQENINNTVFDPENKINSKPENTNRIKNLYEKQVRARENSREITNLYKAENSRLNDFRTNFNNIDMLV
jgi:hypothetical protein